MARKRKPDEQPAEKKPRRKKQADAPVEEAAAPVQDVPPTEPVTQPEAQPAEQAPQQPEPQETPAPVVTPAQEPELQGAKPRKSGRRAWEIRLGSDEHVWERVTSPDDGHIIFRFKSPVTEEQFEIVQKYGFQLDEQGKEAYRENDPAGRVYADKLAWYLKDLERDQGQGRAAG